MRLSKILPRSPEKRNKIMGVILGAIVALIVSLCYSDWAADKSGLSSFYDNMKAMEYKMYDMRFRVRGPLPKKDILQDIVLVDIDDESWEWKPWPFDRTLYSDMIRAFGTPGSRTKGTFFDVFFFDLSGPILNTDLAKMFGNDLGRLPQIIQQDQTMVNDLKTGLYDVTGKLRGPINPATLTDAQAALKKVQSDPRLQSEMQDFTSISAFLNENQSLEALAPDRDKVLHDAIKTAGNVYLAQIVSKEELTPYGVDDILYNPTIHKIFGKLILMQDRSRTTSQTEVNVNYALRNMKVSDFKRVLNETNEWNASLEREKIKAAAPAQQQGACPDENQGAAKPAAGADTQKKAAEPAVANKSNAPAESGKASPATAQAGKAANQVENKSVKPGVSKAIPFTRAEWDAIKTEMYLLVDENEKALKINYPFGIDIGKDAPVPKEKIFKKYINVVRMQTLIPTVGEYVAGVGYVMPELQKYDGTIRSVAPAVVFEGRMYLHIDLMLAMKYMGVGAKDIKFYEDKIVLNNCKIPGHKKTETITIPLYENGTILVNWSGPFLQPNQFVHRSFRTVHDDAAVYNLLMKKKRGEPLNRIEEANLAAMSGEDIARVKKSMEFFNDKMSLTGLTAADTHDLNPIPFNPRYPLVGMHANLVNTIVNGLFIKTIPFLYLLAIIFGLSVALGFTGGTLKQAMGAFVMLAAMACYTAVSLFLFNNSRMWIPIIPVLVSMVLTYLMVVIYRYMTEGQEAKRMKAMFSTYVNPEVVDTLIQNPDKLRLGGEKMELTAMFALASGPGLDDAETPEELVDRLNEYFTAMTDEIFKHDGMLDKYEGSIIMAVYGAPIFYADNAVKACYSALDMHRAVLELQKKWEAEGKKPIYASVGLNSGMMIAGNMGSESRFNYTIMGDAVNLSSRLLGANKQYNTRLMVSEYTYAKAKDAIIARSIDKIRVKGRDEPVEVFELMGRKDQGLPDDLTRCVEHFEAGKSLYLKQKWDEAKAEFLKALEAHPGDGPSRIYAERCDEFKQNPPKEGAAWDGVYTMTTK